MQSITPFLMFDKQAEEAVKFYTSIFRDSGILGTTHFSEAEMRALMRVPAEWRPGPAGQVKVISFHLGRQRYYAGNGGAYFKFTHGYSSYVRCDSQAEIDELWAKLPADGGAIEECGWLHDKFGVAWQIAPAQLDEWLRSPDKEARDRVALAIYDSKKLEIEKLKRAFEGR